MLTERQLWLFEQLCEGRTEKEVRACHKDCVRSYGAVKDFTQWLVKRLHRQWAEDRRKNTTPYLGD
jgi:hypothetical protein